MINQDFIDAVQNLHEKLHKTVLYYVDDNTFKIYRVNCLNIAWNRNFDYCWEPDSVRLRFQPLTDDTDVGFFEVNLDNLITDRWFYDYESAKQKLIELHTQKRENLLTEKTN